MSNDDKTRDYATRLAALIGATIVPNRPGREASDGITLMTKEQVPLFVFHFRPTILHILVEWPVYKDSRGYNAAVVAKQVMSAAEWRHEEAIRKLHPNSSPSLLRISDKRKLELAAREVEVLATKYAPHYHRAVELLPSIAKEANEQFEMYARFSRTMKSKDVMADLLEQIAGRIRAGNADTVTEIRNLLKAAGFEVDPIC